MPRKQSPRYRRACFIRPRRTRRRITITGHGTETGAKINRALFVLRQPGAHLVFSETPRIRTSWAIGVDLHFRRRISHLPRKPGRNIVQRRMTMELSMTIAIVAALAIRELFYRPHHKPCSSSSPRFSKVLNRRPRAARAIQRLIDLLPSTANRSPGGRTGRMWMFNRSSVGEEVSGSAGRPHSRGRPRLFGGHSFVDQAPITGESMARSKKVAGAGVYAGHDQPVGGHSKFAFERLGSGHDLWQDHWMAVERAEEKSRAPPFKESRIGWRATLFTSLWPAAAITFLITHNTRSPPSPL